MASLGERLLPFGVRRTVRPIVRWTRYVGLRDRDVLLASYPRSGSTWLRFVLTDVLTGRPPEWSFVNGFIPDVGAHRRSAGVLPNGGRIVKTHDRRAHPCRRAVYLVRDVRDVVLSEYRLQLRGGHEVSLDEHVHHAIFDRGSLFGTWKEHVDYWLSSPLARRGDLLVVRYEDLRADASQQLERIIGFLGLTASDTAIEAALERNSLARMREKETMAVDRGVRRYTADHRFVGDGAVAGWRTKLSPDRVAAIEANVGATLERIGYPTGDERA
jgi:hypothetical protein